MGTPHKTAAAIEKHFMDFVTLHDSPSRRKFQLEFAAGAGLGNPASSSENIILGLAPTSSSPPATKKFSAAAPKASPSSGLRLETTTQLAFRGYDSVQAFKPEVKHRIMKADDHDFVEQMFLLWNVHGKKGSGLL